MLRNSIIFCLTSFLVYSNVNGLDENPSILIIGSGSSGIAAATKLWKNNFTNLRILEAENRIGGRVNSIKFGEAYVDLGAEWCHGEEGNVVFSLIKKYGILKHSTETTGLYYSNGTSIEGLYENLVEFAETLGASSKNPNFNCANYSTIGKCFDRRFNSTFIKLYENDTDMQKISLEAADYLQNFICSTDSCATLYDLGRKSAYKKSEGDQELNWDGRGYKTILEVMLEKYPDPSQELPILNNTFLNKEVVRIIWNNTGQVKVLCSDNSTYEADHVIFTPSLGVLKANHQNIFQPALPEEKAAAIRNIGFGAIMKIVLQFPHTWWTPNHIYTFLWSADDIVKIRTEFGKGPQKNGKSWLTANAGFFTAEQNPRVLIGFFSGEMIPDIEQEDDKVLIAGCMYTFRKFLGGIHSNITDPENMIKTTWRSNPHFLGTYSYETAKSYDDGLQAKLAAPLLRKNGDPAVMFAGEATSPHHFSTVHGAIDSGYREADRIVQHYTQS